MGDSAAVRAARYRAHKAGDHHSCRHGPLPRPVSVLPVADAAELDPAAELRALAARLAAATIEEPGNASLARELRQTLLVIPPATDEGDPLADLLSRATFKRDTHM